MEAADRARVMQGNVSMAVVVNHPLRARCWAILAERTASPSEIAEELGETVQNVNYHVKLLLDAKVIELVKEAPGRRSGAKATEHWYRSIQRPMILKGEPDDRDAAERTLFAQAICQHTFAEATVALEAATFAEREDHVIARVPMNVDEDGWTELTELFDRTLHEAMAIEERSTARNAGRNGGGEPPVKVRALLGTFEMP